MKLIKADYIIRFFPDCPETRINSVAADGWTVHTVLTWNHTGQATVLFERTKPTTKRKGGK